MLAEARETAALGEVDHVSVSLRVSPECGNSGGQRRLPEG